MKLTRYTDYALRAMIYLATHEDKLASIRQIANCYGISQNHLMKIVQDLGQAGFVETVRGRNGGLRLARPAPHITLGALVRHTEGNDRLIDCNACLISPACGLPAVFGEAMEAFFGTLDRYRLADMVARPQMLRALFDPSPG